MNSLERHALAEGIFKHLVENTENPLDAVSVLGTAIFMIYENNKSDTANIEGFAADFHRSMVESYNSRSAEGTETRQ